jgi:cold shock CspA family protein
MSLDYNQNYLLTNPAESKPELDTTTSSLNGIRKFYNKLSRKQFTIDAICGKVFFNNPYELFAALVKGGKSFSDQVKVDLLQCICEISDWKAFMPELEFLQTNKLVLSQFLRNPDSPIFWGFLLILLSALYKYQLKIFQLYEGKSLISCEVGRTADSGSLLRLGVVIFPDGFKFSVLKKVTHSSEEYSLESYIRNLKFENKIYEIHLTKNEVNALKILTENLGFFPQLIVDYNDLMVQKEYYENSKTELAQIFDNIVKITTSSDLNSKENPTRLLRIENLGIENLNSRLKAELIFGNKVLYNPIQAMTPEDISRTQLMPKPPGLKEKYLDGSITAQNLDQNPEKQNVIERQATKLEEIENGDGTAKKLEEADPNHLKSFKDLAAVKPIILDQNRNIRYIGRLKFVNEKNKYGFIVKELDGADVFFHLSDMENAGISCDMLLKNKDLRFTFSELKYIGRHNISKKAVEIKLHSE